MTPEEIFLKASKSNYIIIEEGDLKSILQTSEIINEVDTHLSDFIRVIKFNNDLFVQEVSFNNEILLRKMKSSEEVDKFVKERLDYYERKWDGCGCKIDYYE
jgi:hypothetical protein